MGGVSRLFGGGREVALPAVGLGELFEGVVPCAQEFGHVAGEEHPLGEATQRAEGC